jgi:serine/threonine-protein kinase RsbW
MEQAKNMGCPTLSPEDDKGTGQRLDKKTASQHSELEYLKDIRREFGLREQDLFSEPRFIDSFTLPATMKHVREARARVENLAYSVGIDESKRFDLSLAVGEAVANAIEHGNGNNPNGSFTVRCLATPRLVCVSVSDHGPGFNPDELPDLSESLLCDRGRGLHCIFALMDEVGFDFASGTTVRMVKFC